MAVEEKIQRRPNLSVLALVSFVASFIVARTFTILSPATVLLTGGYHIHHYWYGLAMLVIGGWLGISYQSERIDRLAAILFGAGGGLIGDEVGLLLTMENYWTEITYTLVIIFLTFVSILILFMKYSRAIRTEFAEFIRSNASLYFGFFLALISVALFLNGILSQYTLLIAISGMLTVTACVIIVAYFLQHLRTRQ
jgi:hypothetical protein